jgi:hypothetical protein
MRAPTRPWACWVDREPARDNSWATAADGDPAAADAVT